MKNTIKMHPLMYFSLLKPYLIFGIIPSFYSLLSFLNMGKKDSVYFYQIFIFLMLLIFIECRRKCFKIELFDNFLIIKKGIYFKREIKIYKNKITALYIKTNPIERLFFAKTVFINTMADRKNHCEFKFILKKANIKTLEAFLTNEAVLSERKIPFLKVMFWAAASSSAFEGVLLFTPIIRNASRLLGIRLYDVFLSKITDKLRFEDRYLTATVNTVTAVFIFIYLLGFLYELLKNLKMRISVGKKSLSVTSGIITKRKTVLNSNNGKGFCSEQSLLMRILRRQSLKAVTGGYTGKFSGTALISPAQSEKELKNSLAALSPSFNSAKGYIAKKKARFGLFSAILPIILISLTIIALGTGLILIFDKFRRFILFALLGSLLLIAIYGYILLYGYSDSKICFDNSIVAEGTLRFKFKRLFLKKDGAAKIKLRQNPFDRKRGSCKVMITAYSKGGERTTVRWINRTELLRNLENIE